MPASERARSSEDVVVAGHTPVLNAEPVDQGAWTWFVAASGTHEVDQCAKGHEDRFRWPAWCGPFQQQGGHQAAVRSDVHDGLDDAIALAFRRAQDRADAEF